MIPYARIDSSTQKGDFIMTKETLAFVTEKTKELTAAHSCCAELKEAANNWLAAAGTAKEKEAAKAYVAELEADITPIDNLISFAESDMGAKVFGADMAKHVAAHGKDIKAAGAKYCDCPACAACEAILAKKDDLLK